MGSNISYVRQGTCCGLKRGLEQVKENNKTSRFGDANRYLNTFRYVRTCKLDTCTLDKIHPVMSVQSHIYLV